MAAPAMAKVPPPLTREQADALAQRRVKKHDVAIVLLHWFNAFVWLLELTTGLALLTSPGLRVMPWWFVKIVQGFFGARGTLLSFHIAVGLTWIAVFFVYVTFGYRTYLRSEVLKREMGLDGDDIQWLKIRALRIAGLSSEPLPPQGVYNAGQKLFAYVVYIMLPVVIITGLLMTFHWGGTAVVGWAAVLHFAAVAAVVCGLIVHVYMGAVFPEEKPAFFSMVTGSVDELYAYSHHFKWWSELQHGASNTCEQSRSLSVAAADPRPESEKQQ